MLNAIGLQNEGLDNFIGVKLPELKKLGTKIIVSISANSVEDFLFCAKALEKAGVEALELNLSCPNIKYKNAIMFAQHADAAHEVVHEVCRASKCVIIAKLTPNVTSITDIACAAQDAGADALSLVNTFLGMAVDIETCRPKLANVTGGLSGPAIKPIALRMVYQVREAVEIPLIGMGGIFNAEDAVEFMLAGANAYFGQDSHVLEDFVIHFRRRLGLEYRFVNPSAVMEILKGIKEYCRRKKIKDIREIIGKIER